MDPASIILLAKMVTDLIAIITFALPKVDGMSEEDKDQLLITLQGDTNKLIDAIMAKANQ